MTLILLPTPPSSAGGESKKKGQGEQSVCPPHDPLNTDFCHSQLVHTSNNVFLRAPHILPSGHCHAVLYYYTLEQTMYSWQWWWEDPIPSPTWTDEVTRIFALTTDCRITTGTGLMPSDIPETKNTPYTIQYNWLELAADVWTIVELTVPPPTQDASVTAKPEAVNPQEVETLHVTSAPGAIKSEEIKGNIHAERTSTENKEKCHVKAIKGKPNSPKRSNDNSCLVSGGSQMPDLSQCHEYNDNSQAFAEWKGSYQPSCPKWGPPPYLRGHPSRSSGAEGQNKTYDPTASTERSCGQGPSVPPFK